MEVLPFQSIREEDAPLIGADLYNLAKLSWLDFPVADGVVVLPPELKIKTLLEHLNFKDGEIFEQKLILLQNQIRLIPVPTELEKAVAHHSINAKKLWLHLLEGWINQLRSRIWQEGFSPDLTANFSAQPVFFTAKISASGTVFWDQDLKIAVFTPEQGEISEKQREELAQIAKNADKKLLLPQVYSWVMDKKLQIVKVTAFSHFPVGQAAEEIIPEIFEEEKVTQAKFKSVVKVFLQADNSFKSQSDLDGVVVCSQNQPDFDGKVLLLAEYAQNLAGSPVIYKLFDDRNVQLRGALQLIHRPNLLKTDAEVVNFARHKKHLANVAVAIPFLRSPEELKRLKLELSALGITRQGNLKLWIELAVPENFLNLDEYLKQGIDGVLIDLDELSVRIGGFDPRSEEGIFYQKQVNAMLKMLEPALKTLHRENVPAIATGSLAIHDDVLDLLVEKGIYGITVDWANFLSIHERLRLIERRVIKSNSK